MSGIDIRGPIFLSYRQSDGTSEATGLAWALRAAGVPVWHDQTDMPPGDTERRLAVALESGLSGAVLVVTPEIEESRIVREVELPRLLELEENDDFTLLIASVVEREPGKLDYDAPDRLLKQSPGTLSRINQQAVTTANQQAQVARALCRRRVQGLRAAIEAAGRVLTLDVQTRIPPFAASTESDLTLRLRPPRERDRRPDRDSLMDLSRFLEHLPQLVALGGAEHVRVRGGAHLSIAFALGAALATTVVGRVEVVDTSGSAWTLTGNAPAPVGQELLLRPVTPDHADAASRGPVLVYLDLLPTRSDAAVEDLLLAHSGTFAGWLHLRPVVRGPLDAKDATGIVGEAAHAIRQFAGQHRTTQVHLLLRCPYGVALLLGRAVNTLRVHLYEWEDGPDDTGTPADPRYLPSLVVRSGVGGSPVEQVLLPQRPATNPTST